MAQSSCGVTDRQARGNNKAPRTLSFFSGLPATANCSPLTQLLIACDVDGAVTLAHGADAYTHAYRIYHPAVVTRNATCHTHMSRRNETKTKTR